MGYYYGGENMDEQINRVKVCLLGKDYNIRTDQPAKKMQAMANEFNTQLESLGKKFPNLTNTDLALLAGLTLMEEIQRLKDEKKELWELLGEATNK